MIPPVSSYVFMKVLERAPALYDDGMRLLARGRLAAAHDALAAAVAAPGALLLDLGCGTAAVAIACARRGARVHAVDPDAGMLDVARVRVRDAGLDDLIELSELGGAELEDRFEPESFDAVVSCLALSEMAPHEQRYCLLSATSCLRRGGKLALVDEVRAPSFAGRLAQSLVRAPVAALTLVLARGSSRPVEDLAALARAAGLAVEEERRIGAGLALVVARKREEGA